MRFIAGICILILPVAASAQSAGVVTLQVNRTTAQGSLVPTLTWYTNPVATSCQASGGWSGGKAASGTQTLAAINTSTSYTLTCTWGSGSATVNWTPPTRNSNGTTLTNLASYKVLYGTSSASLTRTSVVDDPTRRSTTIHSLPNGTWYFAMRAVNTRGAESTNSNVMSKRINGATAARTVAITITRPAGLRTISTNVWHIRRRADGVWVRIGVIGQIALGRPCDSSFRVAQSHYRVNRADVRLTGTAQSTQLVVLCSTS